MRMLGRLTLLSLFAATGVGVALYVGFATGPLPQPHARRHSTRQHPAEPSRGDGNASPADGIDVAATAEDTGRAERMSENVSSKRGKIPVVARSPDRATLGATASVIGGSVGPSAGSGDPRPTVDSVDIAAPAEDVLEALPQDEDSPVAAEEGVEDALPVADLPRATGIMPVPPDAHQSSETALSAAPEPTFKLPGGPIVAEPHPARAFEVSSEGRRSGLLNRFQFWKRLTAPLLGQVAADLGQPTREPAPLPSVAEESGSTVGDAPRLPVPPVQPPSSVSRKAPGEGDDNLTMQFPDSDIREVLDAIAVQGNLNILATESVQGKVSASLSGVGVDNALDAILKSTGYVAKREGDFIYVGKPEDFDTLEKSLDVIATRVYRPNYVTAAELQTLIQPLVTADAGVVSVSTPAEVGIAADSSTAGGDAFAGGDVVVVRDYEAVLSQIDQVVAEIDVRPLQVVIEAMILSVALDDGNDFGVNFELLRDKDHLRLGSGSPLNSLGSLSFAEGGLKFGFLDSSLGAFLNALETIGDTNVIATPRLMVLNKHRAEILIGEELGYVSTTMTETSTSQSVEFLEVGAQLRLRPFVSSDGLIRMEVHPELSTGSVDTSNPNFTLPNKETTQVTTNIMVRDGCTVIIGGLIREELETTGSQVPFLGNLPWLGVAFRSRNETLQRREIIVLITPHIVYEPETCREGEQSACEFRRRQQLYSEKMDPLGKRHVARRYFRMAQNAWAAGDRDTALRFAEMSVHFDPLNRAAIELRSNIWLGQRAPTGHRGEALVDWSGEHTLEAAPSGASPTTPLDNTVIAPWILEELEGGPPAQPETIEPLHPLDPGQPGRHVDIEQPRRFK